MIDIVRIRKDFRILSRTIGGKPIVYLDSTATSLKPDRVLDSVNGYYREYCANIFRGIYTISEEATREYEDARDKVARFIGAPSRRGVIFTRNATESVNLVAYALAARGLSPKDEFAVSVMEHHSNFVPWQQIALRYGMKFRVWNCDKKGLLDLDDLERVVTRKTKVLAITAVSNVLGTVNPIREIVRDVKRINGNCLVLVDAAQAVPHMPVDVRAWNADFVAFSGHKMLGPTGIGVLWGKEPLLESLPPFMYGGEMITEVRTEKSAFKEIPHTFEAGTPHIAGAIGLGAAADYLTSLGMDNVRKHEEQITDYALRKMSTLKGCTVYGPLDVTHRCGVIAFTIKGIHAHDIAQVANEDNVCIRSGNHCAMPLHLHLGVGATARASFYVYTTKGEVDSFVGALEKAQHKFK